MRDKKSIWFTYAWDDNKEKDVDFAAQELINEGLEVKLDRWNLTAGKRLWEQIKSFIQDPLKSDAWLIYATQASLGSEKCKEEFAYALDRALNSRGSDFPIIAIFPASVDESLIPAGIKTRLFVSLTDPEWKERITASLEKRQPNVFKPQVEPYSFTIHKLVEEQYAIEVRPRAGTWSPFIAAILKDEKDRVSPHLHFGAAKRPPSGIIMTALSGYYEGTSHDDKWWLFSAANEATPTQSYYVICKSLPSTLIFGVDRGSQYKVKL